MAQEQEFDYLLAKHCAPALAGIKPANLVPCAQAALPVVAAYHERLKKQDIYLEFIPCRFGPSLLLVYRKPRLFQVLACPDVQAFLEKPAIPYPTDQRRCCTTLKNAYKTTPTVSLTKSACF